MSNEQSKNNIIAKIVAAYAARPDVAPDDIIELIAKLKHEFSAGDSISVSSDNEHTSKPTPALPISQAVTQNQVFCLCCGKGFKMIKRHLGVEHGLTEGEYRKLFDLPESMPLVAPSYSDRKAAHAKKVGLGKYHRDTPKRDEAYSE